MIRTVGQTRSGDTSGDRTTTNRRRSFKKGNEVSDRHSSHSIMEDHFHMCDHFGCTTTENSATIYRVQSRHGDGEFKVCGEHLIERDVDRAEAIVTDASSAANANILAVISED